MSGLLKPLKTEAGEDTEKGEETENGEDIGDWVRDELREGSSNWSERRLPDGLRVGVDGRYTDGTKRAHIIKATPRRIHTRMAVSTGRSIRGQSITLRLECRDVRPTKGEGGIVGRGEE